MSNKSIHYKAVFLIAIMLAVALITTTGGKKSESIGLAEAYTLGTAADGMFFSLGHDLPKQKNGNTPWSTPNQKRRLEASWNFTSDTKESTRSQIWILYYPATEDDKKGIRECYIATSTRAGWMDSERPQEKAETVFVFLRKGLDTEITSNEKSKIVEADPIQE